MPPWVAFGSGSEAIRFFRADILLEHVLRPGAIPHIARAPASSEISVERIVQFIVDSPQTEAVASVFVIAAHRPGLLDLNDANIDTPGAHVRKSFGTVAISGNP